MLLADFSSQAHSVIGDHSVSHHDEPLRPAPIANFRATPPDIATTDMDSRRHFDRDSYPSDKLFLQRRHRLPKGNETFVIDEETKSWFFLQLMAHPAAMPVADGCGSFTRQESLAMMVSVAVQAALGHDPGAHLRAPGSGEQCQFQDAPGRHHPERLRQTLT